MRRSWIEVNLGLANLELDKKTAKLQERMDEK